MQQIADTIKHRMYAFFYDEVHPWIILIISLILTFTIYVVSDNYYEKRANEILNEKINASLLHFKEHIKEYERTLKSGVAFLQSSDYVNRSEWHQYVKTLDFSEIKALGYTEIIYPNQVHSIETRMRAEGFPDFSIKPKGERAYYAPLLYIEPRNAKNDKVIGFDNASEPIRRKALEEARDTGELRLSEGLKIIQQEPSDNKLSVLFFFPYYQSQKTHDTVQQRRKNIVGFVSTPFLISEMMDSNIHNPSTFSFSINDITPNVSHKHLYDSTLTSHPSKYHQIQTIEIGGRIWQFSFSSTPAFEQAVASNDPILLAIGGLIFDFTLFWVLISLYHGRQKLQEHKKSLEKNIKELEMLHALINNSNDMVFIIRIEDGYVEYTNETSINQLGYTLSEIQAMGIEGFRRPLKEDEPFIEHLKELQKIGHLTDYAILTRKDGTEFPIEANVRLLNYNGTDYNIAVVRDISENELFKQKLTHITQHLNEAQKIAKLGSWCLNLHTGELEWSDEIYELFEIDKATHNPTYQSFLDAIHPNDREMVNTAYTHSVEHHTHYNYVHRLLMRDGRIKYVREQGETFYAEDGTPNESRGTVHDITDEILLQQHLELKNNELMEASARLELATHAAGLGIWVWNIQDGSILWDNRMFTMYLEEDDPESMYIVYDTWKNSLHPDDAERAEEELMYSAQNGTAFQTKFRIIQPSGKIRNIYASGIVKNDAHGNVHYMTGINRDITHEVEMEQSLIVSKNAAETANKIKSDFLANMSHEIRTPLNGVIGLTELLLQTDLQPLQREYLNKSETASRALLSVLNNILDYSKIEANKLVLEMTPFNLDDIINNLIAMLSYKAEQKNLSLETHIEDTVPRLLVGDPLRLQQILSNLVVNALKFTEHGYVRISISAMPQELENHIKLAFAISDSGIGISTDDQTTLFQPFSQVDTSFTRKYGGSGLGLMITKELVDLMEGEITVDSVKGEGSTFTVTALFERAAMIPSSDKKTCPYPFALPNHKSIHLLLVEDNDLNQLVASERLKQMGITCSIANNGLEAVEMVQKETFDAVLMDLQMPVMDGIEATKEIRKLEGFANIPIIALSAAVLQDDLTLALEAGMNDFVAKPIDKTLLQNVLTKWLSD